MEKYKVMLYPRAFRDIDSIYAYIALEKLAPENAKSQTDRIWAALETLDSFPSAHQDRQVGKYAGRGYKQLLIDNLESHARAASAAWVSFSLHTRIGSTVSENTKGASLCVLQNAFG
jgi:toxin ParE1/3/4